MQNAKALVDQFLGSNIGGGQGGAEQSGFTLDKLLTGYGGLATGAAAGGLAGLLMGGGKPKEIAETALTVGGVALVGGIAYKAYQNWQANKQASNTGAAQNHLPNEAAFLPANQIEREALARTLTRAMIAAAKADGKIADEEKVRIASHLEAIDLDAGDRAFIQQELEAPLNIEAVVRSATTPEKAAEVYTASLLAIDENGSAERGYLVMLAARLELDPDLVKHIHASTNPVADKNAPANA